MLAGPYVPILLPQHPTTQKPKHPKNQTLKPFYPPPSCVLK